LGKFTIRGALPKKDIKMKSGGGDQQKNKPPQKRWDTPIKKGRGA